MANVPWIGTGGLPLLGAGGLPLICDDAEECACEPGGTPIDTCEQFDPCFDGTTAAVTISGVTEVTCGSCTNANDTYLVADGVAENCLATWEDSFDVDLGCNSLLNVFFEISLDESDPDGPLTSIVLLLTAGPNIENIAYALEGEDAYNAIAALCNGETVNLDYDAGLSDATTCDWPATVSVSVA